MNKESPLIHQGTAPPAAKNERISLPDAEKDIPVTKTMITNKIRIKISAALTIRENLECLSKIVFCRIEVEKIVKKKDYLIIFEPESFPVKIVESEGCCFFD